MNEFIINLALDQPGSCLYGGNDGLSDDHSISVDPQCMSFRNCFVVTLRTYVNNFLITNKKQSTTVFSFNHLSNHTVIIINASLWNIYRTTYYHFMKKYANTQYIVYFLTLWFMSVLWNKADIMIGMWCPKENFKTAIPDLCSTTTALRVWLVQINIKAVRLAKP